jgi:hypothetical protein
MSSAPGALVDPSPRRPGGDPRRPFWGKYAWKVVVPAVAVLVTAGGIGVYLAGSHSSSGGALSATIELGSPTGGSLVCSTSGSPPWYYTISFPVESVSARVTTADFGVAVLTPGSTPVPPVAAAPPPQPALPCGAPVPDGWYAEFSAGARGPIATFPYEGDGWSNGTSAPVALSSTGWFDIISAADLSGTEDSLHALGVNGDNVTFTGNTTFPAFHGP